MFLGWDKHSITIWYNGMALVLLSMCFLGLGSWLLTVTWIETLISPFIHPSLYILLLIHPSPSHTSISISIYNISLCRFAVAAYPCNPSHPGALTRCKPSCTDQQRGPAKHSRTMTNDCDRSHSVMSRHNYMCKRNMAAKLKCYPQTPQSKNLWIPM